MEKYTVYMHITPNNKKYIGITCNSLPDRWKKCLIEYLISMGYLKEEE